MTLDSQTVLVLGGSSGIGREIARHAAAQGAQLILSGRDKLKLDTAAHELGAIRAEAFDAHDEHALIEFFEQLGPINHVVSMIGDSMSGGFMSTSPETMRHVLMSKFWTNWMIGRLAAPKIGERGSITFTAGTGGRPHQTSATAVANLAISVLVQGLAVELGPAVRVNAVAPTFMDTPFWRDLPREQFDSVRAGFIHQVPLARLATVSEVAASYLHFMTGSFITGQVLAVDGGVAVATGTRL
jgi:NAD(P)-dependent dehydrogenase (short-subunit alcohol dehydrogenase family)